VTFTANVSPATATGSVEFLEGTTVLGTSALSGGSCSLTTSSLTADTHSIIAVYGGDATDLTSRSDVLGQAVEPAILTITAKDHSKPYGDSLSFAGTEFATTGLVGSDSVSSVTLTSGGADKTAAAGSYDITPSAATGNGLANYTIGYAKGTLSVKPATLTITADDQSKVYGNDNPTLTGTIVGLKNDDAITASYSAAADKSSAVGSYDIVPAALDSTPSTLGNYDVSLVKGTLKVTPAPLIVSAVTDSKTYDGTTDSKGQPTITSGTLAVGDTASWSQTFASKDTGANKTIVPKGSVSDGNHGANYAVTFVNDTSGTISQATLTATPDARSLDFGDPIPAYTCQVEGFVHGETAATAEEYAAPSCSCPYTPTTPVSASPLQISCSGGTARNYTFSYQTNALTIAKKPTTVALAVPGTQYSDVSTFTATLSPATAGGVTLTGSVQFAVSGKNVGSPVAINAGGVATCAYSVASQAGSQPVTATFTSTNPNFANPAAPTSQNLVVSPEDATLTYSGDSLGVVKVSLNLLATVTDSAAAGYSGANPESGAGRTIGDIRQMAVAFDVYAVGATTPTATVYAPVLDTGTPGDGIGTAAAVWTSATEGSYQVVARLVGASAAVANTYYAAPNAEAAAISFYANSGQFAIGAGWVAEPTGGCGNFGLAARYDAKGKAKGQFVYVWRGSYKGTPADFVIRSNTPTALSFAGSAYPVTATLSGTATLQVIKACGGSSLYSESGLAFTAKAVDSGKSSGVGSDTLSLTLTGSKASFLSGAMKSFSALALKGGNVVVHLK
jgi:hypothetical protein